MQLSTVEELVAAAQRDARTCTVLLESEPEYLGAQIAFHAQQRAEKYVKAALMHEVGSYGRTHQVDDLLSQLASANSVELPDDILDGAARLSTFVTMARYPAGFEFTEEDGREAIAYADEILDQLISLGYGPVLGFDELKQEEAEESITAC